jgi:hypothetical protein
MAEAARRTEQDSYAQRRQPSRKAVDLSSIVLRPGRAPLDVRIVDISPFGFHARFQNETFQRGEMLHVELPLIGTTKAQIMWSLKGCFGCKFLLPIDAGTFLKLLRAMRGRDEDGRG